MEYDITPLVLTQNDITYDGETTFYYRGVEIGHRKSTIDKFILLQKLIYKEFKIIIKEIQITTTSAYADENGEYVRTSAKRGEHVIPSPEHGYNVCCRVKFSDGTLSEWTHHRSSSTKDGCAAYCAQHLVDDAIKFPDFRASLCGIDDKHKWINVFKDFSFNIRHLNLSFQIKLTGRVN